MNPDRIYLQTSRVQGTLFVPDPDCLNTTEQACIPADYLPPASTSRELEARIYYVSSQSTNRDDVPALRRKRFANANGTAGQAFIDEEIVPGVEDLQVRFGIDVDGDTNIDQYVDPGAVPAGARVVSAQITLRVRAEDRDFGYVDETLNDNYRRIVVSKTIHIRNTRA
jgi:type IV pilus assembly protein PilW